MTDSRSPIPIQFGGDAGEEHRFFQERVRFFAGCIFLISSGFYLIDVSFSAPALGAATAILWAPKLAHLAATLIAGASWVALRRVQPSMPSLRVVDATVTVLLATCYALMAVALLDVERLAPHMRLDPWRAVTDPLMACSYVVLVRALVIPSHASRTMWISAVSMMPIMTFGPYVLSSRVSGLELRFGTLDLAMWSVAAVAVSGIGSRVIFGLRTQVAKIRRLGQYTLEEQIGEGGMGIVYRASPAMLRRPAAIKLLRPDRMDEASLLRFEREVQLTAGLTHPNTVAVFDYGRTPDGIFYYAMEYLDGLSLDQLVAEDGPQRAGRVVHLLTQVCGSLAEAHGVGLIHRDIKPANILLVERGGVPDVVKVVDFGLAKRVVSTDRDATVAVTGINIIQGTPQYLAPEAIRNDPTLDARSDLYAVGAVGYHLLTGRPVFQSGSIVEMFSHHLHTRPDPPSRHSPHVVPPALDDLILRCLAKEAAGRPESAAELQRALSRCGADRGDRWSAEDARAWWVARRTRHVEAPRGRASESVPRPTMSVDLDDRVRLDLPTHDGRGAP